MEFLVKFERSRAQARDPVSVKIPRSPRGIAFFRAPATADRSARRAGKNCETPVSGRCAWVRQVGTYRRPGCRLFRETWRLRNAGRKWAHQKSAAMQFLEKPAARKERTDVLWALLFDV